MTDPVTIVGLAASVVQLADYSAKLSVKLFSVSKQIKNAPRTYEALSQEVAITSTVLRQLGAELKDHSQHRIYKPATVSTTESLIVECQRIFADLTDIAEPNIKKNAGSTAKALAEWKHRLKLPYKEADIVTKRARLEQLKASLNVLLNVLVLAAQVKTHDKSEEATILLREQHGLLQNLRDGMNTLFLVQNAVQKPNIEVSSKISPTTNLSKFATMLADTKFSDNDNLENIPSGIRPYANHIKEHARLVDDLVAVIKAGSYDIDRRTRSRMRKGTYALHCQIWAELSSKHDFYDMEHLLTGHEELADAWLEFAAESQPFGPSYRQSNSSLRSSFESPVFELEGDSALGPCHQQSVRCVLQSENSVAAPSSSLPGTSERKYEAKGGGEYRDRNHDETSHSEASTPAISRAAAARIFKSPKSMSQPRSGREQQSPQSVAAPSQSLMSLSQGPVVPQSIEQHQLDELRACFDILRNRDDLLDIDELPVIFQALGQHMSDKSGAALLHRFGIEVTGSHIDLNRFLQIAAEISLTVGADPWASGDCHIPRLTTVEFPVQSINVRSTRPSSDVLGAVGDPTGRHASITSPETQIREDSDTARQHRAATVPPQRPAIRVVSPSAKPLIHRTARAPASASFLCTMSAPEGLSHENSCSETASVASEGRLRADPDDELDSLLALFANLSTEDVKLLHAATTVN